MNLNKSIEQYEHQNLQQPTPLKKKPRRLNPENNNYKQTHG